MDEILIEEKKYVSSKQAAKMTGYAKDYIGQLCREGRVPARLVGRSWYVLESAIQDHRFGNQEVETPSVQPSTAPSISLTHTWESTRYEASHTETLPSLNRLEKVETAPLSSENTEEKEEITELFDLHDSWKAWFDHVAESGTVEVESTASTAPVKEESGDLAAAHSLVEEEVRIPLHVVVEKRSLREILPIEKREDVRVEAVPEFPKEKKRGGNRLLNAGYTLGAVVAIISIALALIGSGYFDGYFISHSRASFISGITVLNK